ncbi:MAG: response regulator [Ktedonobacteraceae bacterium]
MPHDTRYTVLLIESDESLRRLIALGLHQRGIQVIETSSFTALAKQSITHVDLLVLDLDNGSHDDASLLPAISQHPYLSTLPMVVLAWEPPVSVSATLPLRDCLAKPFDARILHATVENLLVTSYVNAQTPTQYVPVPSKPIASLSPLLAAAGLLLTVIGLMLQALVAGVGILIVLIALLWWTLGKRPEHEALRGETEQQYAPLLP